MKRKVLLTGSEGFIGLALVDALQGAGHEVWRLDRAVGSAKNQIIVDLLDERRTREVLSGVSRCDAVVHLAALAHGQAPPQGETCYSVNTKTTANVLRATEPWDPQFLLFSSIAVYGEADRRGPVPAQAVLRPATEYGASKQACEAQLLASSLRHVEVLRLAPVFTQQRLSDVRKRVFLPGLPFRWRMVPPPEYSLCRLETVVAAVCERVEQGPRGRKVQNIADPVPYGQNALLDWFAGPVLPFPVGVARAAYLGLKLTPGRPGYALRSLCWKLFFSNTYGLEEVSLPAPPLSRVAAG